MDRLGCKSEVEGPWGHLSAGFGGSEGDLPESSGCKCTNVGMQLQCASFFSLKSQNSSSILESSPDFSPHPAFMRILFAEVAGTMQCDHISTCV